MSIQTQLEDAKIPVHTFVETDKESFNVVLDRMLTPEEQATYTNIEKVKAT